jgi:hypothetical protein
MATSSTGLSFQETGLIKALSDHKLAVPLNQRSYAWTDSEVQTLLDDSYKAFDAGEQIYFLGAIVLTRDGIGDWQVADGQQRLATASIIMAAARDFLLELGDGRGATKYEETYLMEYDVRTKTHRAKLRLNYQDNDFFFEQILKRKDDRKPYQSRSYESHDRLAAAADLAAKHLRNITAAIPDAEKAERVYDWVEFLNDSAKLIAISVTGRVGNAFKMFETLNARGLPASQLDIVKNYLFDKAKARLDEIHTPWMSMVANIEDLGEDDLLLTFLRHFWISQSGPTTERELGDKIEEKIRTEKNALDLVKQLDSYSSDYVALLTPREHPRWVDYSHDAREALYAVVRVLGGEQIRPLMLAVAREFSIKEAEKAFELFLSWTVRFLIVGGAGGGVLERQYGLRAMEVTKKQITTAKELSNKMAEVVPNDEVFTRSFSVATVRRGPLARYYLRAIELHLAGEKKPQLLPSEDTTAVNLEHVIPQTPSAAWAITPEMASAYVRRIGNLTLLGSGENVDAGNDAFSEKRKIYASSKFEISRDIGKKNNWTSKEVDERQKNFAQLAARIWPI